MTEAGQLKMSTIVVLGDTLDMRRDFVEISHVTYRKLDELKVLTKPVKIICSLDPFETQNEWCE